MLYGLPRNDPRVLALTDEEITLELELRAACQEDAEATQCAICEGWTYRKRCPWCPGAPAVDPMAAIAERLEAGEQFDWEAELAALRQQAGGPPVA